MLKSDAPDVRGVVLKTAEAFLHIPANEQMELGPSQFRRIMEAAAEKLGLSPDTVKNGLRGGTIGNIIEILGVIIHGHA